MNFEALAIIGGLTLIAGSVLYLPFFLWMKWRGKKALPSGGPLAVTINRRGITFYGAMVVVLFVGFAQEYFAPQTAFGSFVSTWSGRLIFAVCVVVVVVALEVMLSIAGIKFAERRNKDV
jgi:hypothetical protein